MTELNVPEYERASAVHKLVRRFAASGPGSWLFARVLHRIDLPINRLTRGRHTLTSLLAGLPVLMLTTTGRRSGQPRTLPLVYVTENGDPILFASSYGRPRFPAWYHNLKANPLCEVARDGVSRRCRAVEIEGPEREKLYEIVTRIYPGYRVYQERTAGIRRVPVLRLSPADGA